MPDSDLVFNAYSVEHPSLARTGFTTDLEVAKAWCLRGATVWPLHMARWPLGGPLSPNVCVESRSAEERAAMFSDVHAAMTQAIENGAGAGSLIRTTAERDLAVPRHRPGSSAAGASLAAAADSPPTEQKMTREQVTELVRSMQQQFLEVLRRAGVPGAGA